MYSIPVQKQQTLQRNQDGEIFSILLQAHFPSITPHKLEIILTSHAHLHIGFD